MRFRFTYIARLGLIALLLAGIAFQPQLIAQAAASLSIIPLTWNVVGLDSNNVNVGPANFPVGARVCNTGDATANNVIVDFVWDDGLNDYNGDPYINLRSGSYTSITVPSLAATACKDFYFEISVTRSAAAYNMSRDYRITADSDETALVNTPAPREIFVERLVSQNRNSVTDVKLNGVSIAAGGTMNLMVGSTYTIQLVGATATNGYEQIESFINFPNTIFQVNSVVATYSAFPTPHTDPNWASKLYADGCGWVNDPNDIVAPAYRECTGTGKYGGNITITYNVTIIGGGGTSQTLNTLIYDFSGSSYHYNSDFSSSGRIASITTPSSCTDANRVSIATWNFNDQNTIVDSINGMSGVMNTGGGVTTAAYQLRSAGNYAHQSGNWSTVTANQEYLEFVVSTLGFTGIKLSFDAAQDNGNGPDNVDIQYSTNGTNFVTSLTTDPLSTTFAAFSSDLSSITALDDNSSARFRLVGTNASQDSRFLQLDNVTISGCPLPRGLTLSKSASPTTYSGPGQAIAYTYTLVNTGLAPLRAPFDIADNREPAVTVSCTAATSPLAPGASTTCTGAYNTTAGDVTALSVTNTATATGTFNGASVSSNTTSATIAYPALNVMKEVSVDNSTWSDTSVTVNAGSPVYYRISVDNTGGANLTGMTVEEDMAACTLSGPTGDSDADNILDPTETWIYTCTVTALAGTHNNTATADSAETGPDTDTASYVGNAPSMNVEKTSTTTAITTAGQIVPYTFTVTNTGNIPLTGITVTDPLCDAAPVYLSGDGNLDNALDLAEAWIYSCSRTATQAQLDAGGNLSNTVTADSAESAPDTATLDIPITQTPALTIAKSVAETSYDSVGDVLHYSYVVTNSGNVTLSGPFVVTDDQSTDETCPVAATLAPGARITCTASYTVTQADLDAGEVINVASAHGLFAGTPVHSTTDTETVPAVQNPAMAIVKTASPATFDAVGDAISYSFVVTNSGNVTLTGPFTVADDKAIDEACPATATLAPGASITCTASYTVAQADLDAGSVTNIAAASASFDGNTITSATDTETVTAVQSPALSMVKTASPATYSMVGGTISYSYAVTNSGNVTLSGPFSVADDRATDEACPATATLAPGAGITCTASYAVTQADLDSGSVTNIASASGSFGGNAVTSATDTETVTAVQNPALTVVKTANPLTYGNAGALIGYSYLVTNSGNVTLSGPFTITDDKSTDESCPATATLAPGQSLTCSATYTVAQSDLDSGSVTNVAAAHGFFGTDPVDSSTDSETANATQTPALTIDKSVAEISFASVGEVLHYSYLVTNSGNVTLSGPFTVTDDKSTDESCPATATLAPGANLTCIASYAVTQADLDAGGVTNTASAHGFFGAAAVDSATDTQTVNAAQNRALVIAKSVTETSYAAVGDLLHYSYLVTNSGNVTLSGPFTVADDRATDEACPAAATLAPGASISCTATYTISQADLDAGSVTNIASVTNGSTTSPTDTQTVPADQNPALTIAKTASPATYSTVGAVINYSYEVTNSGNVTLSGPFTVADDKSADESCPNTASLTPGASITCTATYTITQADIDGGSVTNSASATGSFGGTPVTSLPDTETVTAAQAPALTIAKSATEASYASVGDLLHYSYLVTNSGNVTLSGLFNVTDDKATDEACPVTATLAPGAGITCTATYAVTQSDLDAGSVTNIASATNGTVTSPADSATVPAVQAPALAVAKSVTELSYSSVGDLLHYSYLVTNSGNVTLGGPFTITDDKSTDEACPATATLLPGGTLTCTATYKVTQADLDASAVTNVASAHATFGSNPVNSATDTETVTGVPSPALTIDKSVTEASYASAGDVLHYSYIVANSGNVSLSGPFSVADDRATDEACPATPALAPGASITCTASYTVTQADLDAGSVTNVAFATNGVISSPTDTATVNAVQTPGLTIAKSVAESSYSTLGEVLHYSYLVTNSGNVTLSGPFLVTDDQSTDETCPSTPALAPGVSITCAATYVISQADLNAGSVTNVASAHALFGGTPVHSAADTRTVNATQDPALSIDKSVAEASYSVVGDVLHYSYLVMNTGNVTLTGPFSVTDDKSGDETCPATANLLPGGSITCTATYVVTQADLDAGAVTNIASAHASFGGAAVDSSTDTATVNASQSRALSLAKNVTEPSYVAVGDVLHYSYLVSNSGNVTLTGAFTVADDKATDEACPATATLAPGASITCTASYSVTQADLDAGSVANIASATNGTITSATDTETVNALQTPVLAVVKTASPATYSAVGEVISYTFELINAGNVTLTGPFTVADDKASDESCPATASLAPAASITCTASYAITQADLDSGSVTNVASASGSFGGNAVTSPTDTETVTAAQSPALAIVKSVTESAYSVVGEILHYSYLVTNSGNVTLDGPFTITDDKSGDETCPATLTLVPGGSITCSASYVVTQADVDAGSVTNVASAHASFGGNAVNSGTDTRTVNAVQLPAIAFVKTAIPSVYSTVGDVISYSYEVRNTGNVTLQGPFIVADDRVTDEACPATATLAPGASLTCTASYTISQMDLDTGNVTNVASASGSFAGNTITSPTDTETVTATQNPALSMTKSVTEVSYANVGDVLHYSYLVRNSGNVTLSGPFTVTDDRSTDEACPATATLLPGASITCTATYTVTANDINDASVTNIASAHGFFAGNVVDSGTDTETVDLAAAPSIVLIKTLALDDAVVAPGGVVNAGDTITYTFSVQNTGNVTVTNIVVTDPLLPTLSCTIASLPFGQSASCAATNNVYVLTQADVDAGSRANTATATGQDPGGSPVADSDSRSTSLTLVPAIQLTKTGTLNDDDGVPGLSAGDTISYAFTVTNNGNVTLTNVILADTLGGVTISGGPISSLLPGVSDATTFTGSYTLTPGDINAGSFTNTATVTGTAPDGSDATDTDDDVQTLLAQASIVLSKTATVDDTVVPPAGIVDAGDAIRYTFSVENTGNVTVTNINVTDPLLPSLGCTIASLAPGGVTSCIATGNVYPLTQADIDAGVVANTATATGFDPGNNSVTDPDMQRTELAQSPRLVLTKTGTVDDTVVPPGGIVNAGDTVAYSFSVANTGNVTITNISVTDPLLPALACTISSLAPGASGSCTPTNNVYTLTQADIDGGSRVNTATATGKDPADNDVLDTDTQMTTIKQSPSIRIVKEVSADAHNWNDTSVGVTVGDTVYYRVRVSNTGNTTQTGLSVDDGMAACTPTREKDLTGNDDNVFEAGEEWAYTCSVTAELGTHNNTATGTTNEAQQASDSASYVASAVQVGDPAIAKVGDPAQASVGEVVTFTLTVTNAGNAPAPNVVITDALPAIFDVTAVNVSGAPLGTVVSVTPLIGTGPAPYTVVVTLGGDLGVTDVVTIDIVTTVNSLGNPPITNTASLTTTAANDIVSNNSAALTIVVREAAGGKLPATGFARNRVTRLVPQPLELAYAATDLLLEIPSLGVKIPIVGVPRKSGTWNVSWLGDQAGWLQGSAFPSWNGNSLLTGHVYLSNGLPGPFVNLNKLKYGDRIIVHAYGEKYTFAVQTNTIVEPNDASALKHEEKPWLTLITCKEYDAKTNTYRKRVVVRAALISVAEE